MNELVAPLQGELFSQAVRDVMSVERRCLELKAEHKDEIKNIGKGAIEAARRHGVNIKAIQQIVKMLGTQGDVEIGSFMRTLEHALRIEGIAYTRSLWDSLPARSVPSGEKEIGNEY